MARCLCWLVIVSVVQAWQPTLSSPRRPAHLTTVSVLMQAGGLQADQDRAVAERAAKELAILQPGEPLLAVEQRRAVSSAGGFGGASSSKAPASKAKKKKKPASKGRPPQRARSSLAQELRKEGVVRIDGALTPAETALLRDFVDSERAEATRAVAAGEVAHDARFAGLVLLENRCDLLLPLRGPSLAAVSSLLKRGSVLGDLLTEVVGDAAVLQEVACLISEPGSQQQPLHPDTPWSSRPSLYAAFVALQDVDLEMGPTVYLPGTQTQEAHQHFYGGAMEAHDAMAHQSAGLRSPPIATDFLASRQVKLGTLRAGDLALYNQQVLHCGSANLSEDRVRRQFYLSVRDPTVPVQARASMRPAFVNKLTLGQIRDEIASSTGLFERLDALDAACMRKGAP